MEPRTQSARFIASVVDSQAQGLLGIFVRCWYLSSTQHTLQIPAEPDEKFLLIDGAPTPPPHSHPPLLELGREGAAGVQYRPVVKLNRPKVFRDNVFLYQTEYLWKREDLLFWPIPTALLQAPHIKNNVFLFPPFLLFFFLMALLQWLPLINILLLAEPLKVVWFC